MNRIIYLHGFASSPASRKAAYFQARFEEKGVQIAIPDLAEGGFENLSIGGQLRVIERVAGTDEVSLIGSSLGGYLAALYAARHQRVRKAVLMAPAFGFGRRYAASLGEETLHEWKRSGFLEVPHYGTNGVERLGWGLMEDALRYEEEPAVEQPVLIFHGVQDTVVPIELSRQYAAARPAVTLRELDSDHALTDAVDAIWAETYAFLQ